VCIIHESSSRVVAGCESIAAYERSYTPHPYTQVAVGGLLSLAYSPETHQCFAKPYIIEGVIEACGIQRTTYQLSAEERVLECQLLKYVSLVSAVSVALIQLQ